MFCSQNHIVSGNICPICEEVLIEPKVKVTTINKVSKKQAKINVQKAKQMKEFKKERKGYCSACGKPSLLTNSHLIPVGQRKNLELNKMNQVWHCVDNCHPIWEHDKQGRKKMRDYKSNMEKIKELDFGYYNLMISKYGI